MHIKNTLEKRDMHKLLFGESRIVSLQAFLTLWSLNQHKGVYTVQSVSMSLPYLLYLIDFHAENYCTLYRAAREGETTDTAAEALEMQQRHRSDHTAGISEVDHTFLLSLERHNTPNSIQQMYNTH
jgi:hypothetical protein